MANKERKMENQKETDSNDDYDDDDEDNDDYDDDDEDNDDYDDDDEDNDCMKAFPDDPMVFQVSSKDYHRTERNVQKVY